MLTEAAVLIGILGLVSSSVSDERNQNESIVNVSVSDERNQNESISSILADIFDGYDKTVPPNQNKDPAERQVKVIVNMWIISMFSISEMNMDYSMSMFLRERWVDDRLRYTDTLNLSRIVLDNSLFDTIWMPDMYILNEKESSYHEVTVPNKLIHIYPDGTVQYSARVTGIFSCHMKLQPYPFDKQSCHFEVESYGHSTEIIKFVWSEKAVTLSKDMQFPQFSLTGIKSYSCEQDYYGIYYPCVGVKFVLERNYEYHLVQIYVPSILTVLLSWVNFWLDCDATPARISLGLLTVLTMTTQSSGARANLPRVSYIKAIDVYMAACITFVFLGLVEFAYVNVLARVDSRRNQNDRNGNVAANGIFRNIEKEQKPEQHRSIFSCFKMQRLTSLGRARRVDKLSRVIFPVTFAVFNIIYWIYYLLLYPHLQDAN